MAYLLVLAARPAVACAVFQMRGSRIAAYNPGDMRCTYQSWPCGLLACRVDAYAPTGAPIW